MKERGFAILLHYGSAAPWENFTSYSCDDSCKRESFTSLWKPPAKKHRHRVRAEIRAVSRLLLVVLSRGEKLGRGADEPDKRREMRAHSHRPAQPRPTPIFGVQAKSGRSTNGHFASE